MSYIESDFAFIKTSKNRLQTHTTTTKVYFLLGKKLSPLAPIGKQTAKYRMDMSGTTNKKVQ